MYRLENEYGKIRVLTHENSDFTKSAFCYTSKVGFYEFGKTEIEEMMGTDEYIIVFTVGGCGAITIGDTDVKAVANSITVIPAYRNHSYRTHFDCDEWSCYVLSVGGATAKGVLDYITANGKYTFVLNNGFFEAVDMIDEIMSIDNIDGQDFELRCALKLHNLLHGIYKAFCEHNAKFRERSQITELVCRHIKQHYRESITLDDLSKRCYISTAHLIRVFKDDTGVTPYNYLKKYRIDRAKELLHYTVISIKDIAMLVGFSDPSNFIKQFKSMENMTPDAYREVCLKKILI